MVLDHRVEVTPGVPVLQNISVQVDRGQIVALVGRTGAGKSTLVSLVPRLIDPWEGRVLGSSAANAPADRILVRPCLSREFLGDHHDRRCSFAIVFVEQTALHEPHAERLQVVVADDSVRRDRYVCRIRRWTPFNSKHRVERQ